MSLPSDSLLLRNARVVTPVGVLNPGWIQVEGQRIAAVGAGEPGRPDGSDLGGDWVVPGFVDQHVHGGGGASYQSGDADEALRVRDFHRAHGTTTSLASLITAPLDDLICATSSLSGLAATGAIAGIHLEGPFLSAAHCGAHDPDLLRLPVATDLAGLLDAGGDAVKLVTLAPELDGGLDAVREVVRRGAVAAVGHTTASYPVTVDAVQAGARVSTHLFNGMPPLHHRNPGPVLALLEDDRVTVELINDGLHVHPAVIREVVAWVGADRVALVTDAIVAAGLGDGEYDLGGRPVRVRDGLVTLVDGGSIAGSTLTMDAVLRNSVEAGVPITDAVVATSQTPARVLGLAHEVGAIATGLTADLVVLDDALSVRRVLAKGAWLS